MQTTVDIRELQERIERESSFVDALTMGMNQVIVGQKHLVESLLIGLLADGHILLEGVPGLAKTLAINTLAKLVKADFSRIQFTPDLLPADLLGTQIYSQKTEEFKVKQGPVVAVAAQNNMPATTTIAAIRSSFGNVFFAVKVCRTCATLTRAAIYFYKINKVRASHNKKGELRVEK